MGALGFLTGIGIILLFLAGVFAVFYSIGGAVLGLSALFVLICIVMMLVILIQKPKGGGLSGAFGGAGGSASDVFGSKTGDVLTLTTVILFVLFLGLGVSLTYATRSADVAGAPSMEEQIRQASQEEQAEGVAEDGAIERPEVPPTTAGEPDDATGTAPESSTESTEQPQPPADTGDQPAGAEH